MVEHTRLSKEGEMKMGGSVMVYESVEAMAKCDCSFEILGVEDVLEAKFGWVVVAEKRNYVLPSSVCLIVDKGDEV